MSKQKLIEKIFEEFPEEKTKYEKMKNVEKSFYKTGLYLLNFRKYLWEKVIPRDPCQ